MRRAETETDGRATLDVRLEAGDLVVTVGEPGRMVVEVSGPDEDDVRIDAGTHGITLRPAEAGSTRWLRRSRLDVRATVPPGADLVGATAAGDLRVTGPLADATVRTASGDIRLDEVERLQAKAASGDLYVETITGGAEITVASGDVRLGRVGPRLECAAASGDVSLGEASGAIRVRSASGGVVIDKFLDGTLEVKTMSSDVTVGIPPRRKVSYDLHSLSGSVELPTDSRPRDDGPTEGTVDIRVRAVSGSLRLRHAD